jgi:hypothetical protein
LKFKDFISSQRTTILVIGMAAFVISLIIGKQAGITTIRGALFVDLAASSITVVFTALIIDYLGIREENGRTKNAAGLAEDEINATCFRVKCRMARLFGLSSQREVRNKISNREFAREFLKEVEVEVNDYFKAHSMSSHKTLITESVLQTYIEHLQIARSELEQTLSLYEYAMSYSLRERVLNLRSELHVGYNLFGFIDFSEKLND